MSKEIKPTSKVKNSSTGVFCNEKGNLIIIDSIICEDGSFWRHVNFEGKEKGWKCILEAGYDKKEEKILEEPIVNKVICESCKFIVSPEFTHLGGGCDYCSPF